MMRLSDREKREIAAPLAEYLMRDRDSAKQLVMRSIEVYDTCNKFKRRRYFPARRRNLLNPTERQALQLFVYEKSSEIEKALFNNLEFQLSLEHFYILYIKHLVWQGTYHNAIWTGIAICKILFDYRTAHLLEILGQTAPNDNANEDHLRQIKGKLVSSLCDHFGNLLSLTQGERNRSEFKPNPLSRGFWDLVQQCLRRLVPVDTHPCPLNSVTDVDKEITVLQSSNYHQCHVLICPECLSIIIEYYGYNKLENKLVLPECNRR